jgi:hypothetical protein
VATGVTLAVAQNQKFVNLFEGETQGLSLRDEFEIAHRVFVKQAKAARASSWPPQQSLPLVKSDRMNAEPRFPRRFANA